MAYEIEKGVPVPEKGRPYKVKYPIAKMEIGDSFVIEADDAKTNSRKSYLYALSARAGIRVTTRKQPDGSLRVWRIA
jgi:hypothetical protein